MVVAGIVVVSVTGTTAVAVDERGSPSAPTQALEELPHLRTARSTTLESNSGVRVARIYPRPIHFRTGNRWQQVENRLVRAGAEFRNDAGGYEAVLPDTLQRPVRMAHGASRLSMRLRGSRPVAPLVQGSAAEYRGVFQDVDVRLQARADGLKEDIVLSRRSSRRSFTYEVGLSRGLSAQETTAGGVNILDETGDRVFALTPPVVYDAAHASSSSREDVSLRVVDSSSSGATLVLEVDADWLNDEQRAFPVVIDPSISYEGYSIRANTATDATYVDSYVPSGDFGESPELYVGDQSTASESHNHRALLRFDVADAIPPTAQVLSASLGLTLLRQEGSGDGCLRVREMARGFTERANWNSPDGTTTSWPPGGDLGSIVSEELQPSSQGDLRFDQLRGLAQRWVRGQSANHGMAIESCNSTRAAFVFASDDAHDERQLPYLQIWYWNSTGAPEDQTFLEPGYDGSATLTTGPAPEELGDVQVNLATGNLLLRAQDDGGTGTADDLHLDRFYNSWRFADETAFGRGWTEGEGHWVKALAQPDGGRLFLDPAQTPIRFAPDGQGGWRAPDGTTATMTPNADGSNTVGFPRSRTAYREWGGAVASMDVFAGAAGTAEWLYDANDQSYANLFRDSAAGRTTYTHRSGTHIVTQIAEPDGRRYQYTYRERNGYRLLASVTDPDGRTTHYLWDDHSFVPQLLQVREPGGARTEFTYDPALDAARVSSVTRVSPDGTSSRFAFHYQQAGADCAQTAAWQTRVESPGRSETFCIDHSLRVLGLGRTAEGESEAVQEIAAEGYANEFNVSREEARRVLTIQDRAGGLGEAIADSGAAAGYAGVWFDDAERRLKVGLRTGTDSAPVTAELASRGLLADTDILALSHTQRELEEGRDRVVVALQDLVDAGTVSVGFDTSRNAVVIGASASITAAQRSRADAAAASEAVRTVVQEEAASNYLPELLGCSTFSCDPPFRGGVAFENNQGSCTSGFIAGGGPGNATPYVITAGHCLSNGPAVGENRARLSNGAQRIIGFFRSQVEDERGDFGIFGINENSVYRRLIRSYVVVTRYRRRADPPAEPVATTADSTYPIRVSRRNGLRFVICGTGQLAGTICGRVTALGRANGRYGSQGIFQAFNCPSSTAPVFVDGDSGAPFFKRNYAFGILSARVPGTRCAFFFSGAKEAEDALNVQISPP